MGDAQRVLCERQLNVLADSAIGQHVDNRVHSLYTAAVLRPLILTHSGHQLNFLLVLNMIHHLNDRILAPTAITIPLHHNHIALPPRGVINLIHSIIPRIQQIPCVHDIIQPGVDSDIGGEVDDFDVDLLEVGAGDGVGVLDVEGVGDVWVEDLG